MRSSIRKLASVLLFSSGIPLPFLLPSVFALPKNPANKAPTGIVQQPSTSLPKTLPLVFDEELLQTPSITPPAFRSLGISPSPQSGVPFVDVAVGTVEHPGGNNHMRRQLALGSDGKVHMIYKAAAGTGIFSFWDSLNLWLIPYYYNVYNCDGGDSLTFSNPRALPLRQTYPPAFDSLLRPRWIGGLGGLYMAGGNIPRAYGGWYRQNVNTNPLSFSRLGSSGAKSSGECTYDFTVDTIPFAMNTSSSWLHPVSEAINDTLWVTTYRDVEDANFVYSNRSTDAGTTWSPVTAIPGFSGFWYNATTIAGNSNLIYILSHTDPVNLQAFQTTEHPCYVKSTDGGATWSAITEITGMFVVPGYLANGLGIDAIMVGDTLHVLWTDWNNWDGNGFPGPGGHVWQVAVEPDGTTRGPYKVADINIDGREPDRSATIFGFGIGPWMNVSLSYRSPAGGKEPVLYAFWSQPPDNDNFGFADSVNSAYAHLGNFDIFCAASPNNGRSWDNALNITQTNAPGCDGTSSLCASEDHFVTTKNVFVDDPDTSKWFIPVMALVHAFPGVQELAILSGIAEDGGPHTFKTDRWRLYFAPARDPVPVVKTEVFAKDTTDLENVHLFPRGGTVTIPMQIINIGTLQFYVDSVKLTGNLNDGQLTAAVTGLNPGDFFDYATRKDFDLVFNSSDAFQGLRSGFLEMYVSASPPNTQKKVIQVKVNAYVVPTLCLNQLVEIHSSTNSTPIGTQGSIADKTGLGLFNPVAGLSLIYDGGLFVWNSELNAPPSGAGIPRRVTRQILGERFLQCVSGYELDSVAGADYHNIFLKSVSTDLHDTSLVFLNIWEQSTHPDSSDFLIQTVRAINIGGDPIDMVALGVLYDIDVFNANVAPPVGSNPSINSNGDTVFLADDGRHYQLGWQSGNDFTVDDCKPNNEYYGAVFIPDSTRPLGDTIGPAGAVFFRMRGFTYNIDNHSYFGSDTLLQRYARFITGMCTTEDPRCDTLTGVTGDSTNGDRCTGNNRAVADDLGYMAILKRVTNFPVNGGGQNLVARYGLDGLAASIDTAFSGPGESFTVIHLAANNGMAELIANAQKAVKWYNDHANAHVGSVLTMRKGDLNENELLDPSDLVMELLYAFTGKDIRPTDGKYIPVCVADLNNDGGLPTLADVVLLLNGVYDGSGCPNCLRPCI